MCPDITSRHHRIVRTSKAAARGESALALLDGWHLLREAVAANIDVVSVALSAAPRDPADQEVLRRLSRDTEVLTVSPTVMDALSPTRTPSGVVALARPRMSTVSSLLSPAPALVAVAVDAQDPGNVGAIVRSAEAGGATGVWLAGKSADAWNWKALRAAMGSTFRLPIVRTADTAEAVGALRRAGLAILATVPRGGTPMHEVDLRRPAALLLGGEGAGLSEQMVAAADARLTIPMNSSVESLNVAMAAAVLIYEAQGQRR